MPDSSLRILQVCSASRLIYGAAHSLMTLAQSQREAGKIVEFLTFKGKQFGGEVRQRGFPTYEVNVRAKIDLVGILQMRQLMRAGRFDIIHTHLSTSSVNGCLAAKLARIPSVATVHGMSAKWSFAAADHLIGVSDQVKHHLVEQGVQPEKVTVVYNGLELPARADRDNVRSVLNIPADRAVIGTVARVTEKKGIDDVIRALPAIAREIPDVLYLVIGDGDGLDRSRALALELGVGNLVRFEGYQQNVQPYLSAMDVFVFPSHKEAMGIALVEAMAAGLSSVASDVDGIPEVLTPDCGLLVPVSAPEHLAVSILHLLNNGATREAMGKSARLRAEKVFSARAMEQSTDWVYRGMLGQDLPIPSEHGQNASAIRDSLKD